MKEWFKRYRKSYDRTQFVTDLLLVVILAILIAGMN